MRREEAAFGRTRSKSGEVKNPRLSQRPKARGSWLQRGGLERDQAWLSFLKPTVKKKVSNQKDGEKRHGDPEGSLGGIPSVNRPAVQKARWDFLAKLKARLTKKNDAGSDAEEQKASEKEKGLSRSGKGRRCWKYDAKRTARAPWEEGEGKELGKNKGAWHPGSGLQEKRGL